MKKIKEGKKIFVIFVVVTVVLLGLIICSNYVVESRVKIGDVSFDVEVVSAGEDMKKGLSGRDGLDDGDGMLFVLPELDHSP